MDTRPLPHGKPVARFEVRPNPTIVRNGVLRLSAELVAGEAESWEAWFELPDHFEDRIESCGDSWALAALFPAMSIGAELVVHGCVGASLLRNLEEFQAAFHAWHPQKYQPIRVFADTERDVSIPDRSPFLCAFSGGLDSTFSVHRHIADDPGRRRRQLGAGLMVHGFDIPLDDETAFSSAFERARDTLAGVGLPLIPVRTNLKESIEESLDLEWREIHGALLASCLHLFSGIYCGGLVAGTYHYARMTLLSHGSNPLTDPMMSSDYFPIVHDGAEFYRTDKARAISGWKDAMTHLRVCWEGERLDRNCGRCSKCIRMITGFWALGLDAPTSFDVLPSVTEIAALELAGADYLDPIAEILFVAAKNGHHDTAWFDALTTCLNQNQHRFGSPVTTATTGHWPWQEYI